MNHYIKSNVIGWILFAFVLATVKSNPEELSKSDLIYLCNGSTVKLYRISFVKPLVDLVKSGKYDADCSEGLREAILSLGEIINDSHEDLCTSRKFSRIQEFHKRYVDTNKPSPLRKNLPDSLRHFFIAYVLRLNAACKRSMISSLSRDTKEFLKQEDFDRMELWSKSEDSLMNRSAHLKDFDDIILIGELVQVKYEVALEEIYVEVSNGAKYVEIQEACRKRYKPFYKQLILPLIGLSNLGYNYKGREVKAAKKDLRKNKEAHLWYKITFICEAIDNLVIFDSNDTSSSMRILRKEETEGRKVASITNELERLVYEPRKRNVIRDIVIEEHDSGFMKLLDNFNQNSIESDRVKLKLLKRYPSIVGAVAKNKLKSFFSKFKGGNSDSFVNSREIIKTVDDYYSRTTKWSSTDGDMLLIPKEFFGAVFDIIVSVALTVLVTTAFVGLLSG